MSVRVAAPGSSAVVAASLTFFWTGDVWHSDGQAVKLSLRAMPRLFITQFVLPFAVRNGCNFQDDARSAVQCRRRGISVFEKRGVDQV
jgi:hypothetical protein